MYHSSQKLIESENVLVRQIERWKFKNEKIVITNGCFDLLHVGHIDYLEKARALGSVLVVGLNSDASIKRLKGEKRPVLTESVRARMLCALEFISAVVVFEEDTPERLIRLVSPHILVKGGDYSTETMVGADFVRQNGGQVLTIPLLEGFSTTKLIADLQK